MSSKYKNKICPLFTTSNKNNPFQQQHSTDTMTFFHPIMQQQQDKIALELASSSNGFLPCHLFFIHSKAGETISLDHQD
jgi:hypothetical protein